MPADVAGVWWQDFGSACQSLACPLASTLSATLSATLSVAALGKEQLLALARQGGDMCRCAARAASLQIGLLLRWQLSGTGPG